MYIPRKTCAGLVALLAFAATGCAILKPEPSGLGEDIVVSSSEPPSFEAQDVDDKEITSDLGAKSRLRPVTNLRVEVIRSKVELAENDSAVAAPMRSQ